MFIALCFSASEALEKQDLKRREREERVREMKMTGDCLALLVSGQVNIKISNFLPIWSLNSSISSDIFSL